MRNFSSVYTEENRQGVRGAINSGSNRGRFFSVCGGDFSGYTEENRQGGLPQGLIRAQSGGDLFSMRGRFFSVCGSPVTCFAVIRETRVLIKIARGVPVGINSSPIRGRFFQYAGAIFQVILKKSDPRWPAKLINDRIGTDFFQDERFFRLY